MISVIICRLAGVDLSKPCLGSGMERRILHGGDGGSWDPQVPPPGVRCEEGVGAGSLPSFSSPRERSPFRATNTCPLRQPPNGRGRWGPTPRTLCPGPGPLSAPAGLCTCALPFHPPQPLPHSPAGPSSSSLPPGRGTTSSVLLSSMIHLSVRLLTCLSALRSVHPPIPHRRSQEAAFVCRVGLGPRASARPRAGAQETQLSERAKDLKGHWRLSPASAITVLRLSCPQDTQRGRPGCATAQNVGVRSQLHVYSLCGLSVPICAKETAKEAGAGPFSVPGPVLNPKHLPSTHIPAHYYDDPHSPGQKLSPEESSGCPRRHNL